MGTSWHEEMRAKNREEIISAARALFLQHDFLNVGIKDICSKAGVSRVTFYKYFDSINDLALEVQIHVMTEMMNFINEHFDGRGTGIQKLENMLHAWLEFVRRYPNHMKYIGFFDHYYRDRYPSRELTERYRQYVQQERNGLKLAELIREGIADGTIRDDLDDKQLSAAIFETMISLFQRMSSIGEMIKQEHGVELEDIARTMFDMIINYAKSRTTET